MSTNHNVGVFVRRYPLALACAAVVLVFGGFYYLRQGKLTEATARAEELEAESNKLERNVRNSAGMEEHLDALKAAVVRLEGRLTRADDVSGNQEYFYGLEAGTGVRVSTLRPLGPPKSLPAGQTYQPTGFSVVVEGDYAQLIGFLRALELGSRLYRLTDFSVQRASGDVTGSVKREVLTLNLQLLAAK